VKLVVSFFIEIESNPGRYTELRIMLMQESEVKTEAAAPPSLEFRKISRPSQSGALSFS
jgi:hypothetical protein